MFTISNTRTMAQSERRSDVGKRTLGVGVTDVLKSSRFFALATAALLIFVAAPASVTHAQSGYWATDGCYYQHNGSGYQAIECRSYDTNMGTWSARTNTGTFYLFEGRWYDKQNYLAMLVMRLEKLNAEAKQQKERDAWNSYRNNQALIKLNQQREERLRDEQKLEEKREDDNKHYINKSRERQRQIQEDDTKRRERQRQIQEDDNKRREQLRQR